MKRERDKQSRGEIGRRREGGEESRERTQQGKNKKDGGERDRKCD